MVEPVRVTGPEVARVMVTVKTYPNPSDRHGETVCVAGVRLDTSKPEWIRLYPMKYRLVDYGQQFAKYEIIDIPVVPHGTRDPRPESMRPDQNRMSPIRKVPTLRNWAERRSLMGDLLGATTTCDLIAVNRSTNYAHPAPSLGLVRVRDVRVTVTDGTPWDDRQQAKVVKAAMPDLFNPEGIRELEPPPFKVKLAYRCDHRDCGGHEPSIIDWETGQAGRRWLREKGLVGARAWLNQKYEELLGDDRDAHVYVGNLHQHRTSFAALGVWSAKKELEDSLF